MPNKNTFIAATKVVHCKGKHPQNGLIVFTKDERWTSPRTRAALYA